jgi:H+-transporting ATPase
VERTGMNTRFGKAIDLLKTSHPRLHSDGVVAKVAWAMIAVTVLVVVLAIIVAFIRSHTVVSVLPLLLMLLVSGVPVALPAMFTLTMALGALELHRKGVLVTRLNATEDAAGMTVLCVDKTGTITTNLLTVAGVQPITPTLPAANSSNGVATGEERDECLAFAGLASNISDQDPIDVAILEAITPNSACAHLLGAWHQMSFRGFDPTTRRTEAVLERNELSSDTHTSSENLNSTATHTYKRVAKGAVSTLLQLLGDHAGPTVITQAHEYMQQYGHDGCRTLAIVTSDDCSTIEAVTTAPFTRLLGVVALRDPPRPDSTAIVQQLHALGIRVFMLTGDATNVGKSISTEVGIGPRIISLSDAVAPTLPSESVAVKVASNNSANTAGLPIDAGKSVTTAAGGVNSGDKPTETNIKSPAHTAGLQLTEAHIMSLLTQMDGMAEIYPEHKHLMVATLQKAGNIVGMTGDGVNDAAALKQAEVGIAVSNATDVAKGAASAVMIQAGLCGIVELIRVSREIRQRITTWILNKVAKTFMVAVFVVVAYFATEEFIIDALGMVLILILVDFVTLALSTDRATGTRHPEPWRVGRLTAVAICIGIAGLVECLGLLYILWYAFDYRKDIEGLRTLIFLTIFFFSVLNVFVVRERRPFYYSFPSYPLLIATTADSIVAVVIATVGIPGMTAIPLWHAAVVFAYIVVVSFGGNDLLKLACYSVIDSFHVSATRLGGGLKGALSPVPPPNDTVGLRL